MTPNLHLTAIDQLVFQDPVIRYPRVLPPPKPPRCVGSRTPAGVRADLGERSYRGTGRLVGRRALVAGGGGGIGAATAIAFAREGADVVITHLPQEQQEADRVLAIIEDCGCTGASVPGDLHDRAFPSQLVSRTVEAVGGLDILVNNGPNRPLAATVDQLDDQQMAAIYDVNVFAFFRLVRAALPHLAAGATIINTASVQACLPSAQLIDYASTKAAVRHATRALARALASRGIRVNAVAPGPIWAQPDAGQPADQLPELGRSTPLGRAGQPTEVATAFVFLASPESSYVLGETLSVNGGLDSC